MKLTGRTVKQLTDSDSNLNELLYYIQRMIDELERMKEEIHGKARERNGSEGDIK